MRQIDLWREPYILLETEENHIIQRTEITEFQASFLCGAIRESKPKKILEVGTSAGGSTCVMMNALNLMEDGKNAEIYTVDLSETYYRDRNKETGYLADYYSQKLGFLNYHKYTGGIVSEVIEEIGEGIDFLYLDAAHVSPGEILDFIVCYPFLASRASVVLHDVSLMHKYRNLGYDITANALLFASVVADKILNFDKCGYTGDYPNIGGFICTEDTGKYIENVFLSLFTKWHYLLTDDQDETIRRIITMKYSKELLDLYDMAVNINKYSFNDKEDRKIKNYISELIHR